MIKWRQSLAVMVVIGLGDQLAGLWARAALRDGRTLWVIKPIVSFQLLFNRGAMLGLLSHYPGVVTVLSVIGTMALILAAIRLEQFSWSLSTMAGGALGNTFSRLVLGQVTDFMRIRGYPGIFDVSDVALRIGVIWFIIALIVRERGKNRQPSGSQVDGELP